MFRQILIRYWKQLTRRKRSRRYRRDAFHAEISRHSQFESLEDRRVLATSLDAAIFIGQLRDAADAPLVGTHIVDFSLFDAATAGALIWSSSNSSVNVETTPGGYFQQQLGELPDPLPWDDLPSLTTYLEVTVDGQAALDRIRFDKDAVTTTAGSVTLRNAIVSSSTRDGDDASYGLRVLGNLRLGDGSPVLGTVNWQAESYDAESGGNLLFSETGSLVANDTFGGAFAVSLGSMGPQYFQILASTPELWLRLTVNGESFPMRIKVDGGGVTTQSSTYTLESTQAARSFDIDPDTLYGPDTLNVWGLFRSSQTNTPITGSHNIAYTVYSTVAGGSPLFSESTSVSISDSVYGSHVHAIGSQTPFDFGILRDIAELWIEISVDGQISAAPRTPLNTAPFFAEVTVNLTTVSATLDGSGNLNITDTDGTGKSNQITLSISSGEYVLADPNEQFTSAPAGWTLAGDGKSISIPTVDFDGSITINGGGGDDTLMLDFSTGSPVPTGGLIFNGGAGTDSLGIKGDGTAIFSRPDGATLIGDPKSGKIDIGAMTNAITYTGIEPLDIDGGGGPVTIAPTGGADLLTIADGFNLTTALVSPIGTQPAIVVSGTTGGGFFESHAVWNASLLTINTVSGGTDGADEITVNATTGMGTTAVAALTIDTGADADKIDIDGGVTVAGALDFSSQQINFNSGGTLDAGTSASLDAGSGSIADSHTGNDITTANVTLVAGSGIGASGNPLEVNADTFTNVQTATGGIYVDIQDTGDVPHTVTSASATTSGDIVFTASTGGGSNTYTFSSVTSTDGNIDISKSVGGNVSLGSLDTSVTAGKTITTNVGSGDADSISHVSGALQTDGGQITLVANRMSFTDGTTVSSGVADVALRPFTAAEPIQVGGGTPGAALSLLEAALQTITANAIVVGNSVSNTGTIGVTGALNLGMKNLVLATGNNTAGAISDGTASSGGNLITAGMLLLDAPSGGIDANFNATTVSALSGLSQFLQEADSVTIGAFSLNAASNTITLGGGTFTLGVSNRINDIADVNVTGGATLALGMNTETIDQLVLTDGNVTGSGTGALTATSTFDVRKGSVSAILSGAVGLTKTTVDNVTLSGVNSYSGDTIITDGTLTLSAASNNPLAASPTIDVQAGSVLDVNGLNSGRFDLTSGQTLMGRGTVSGAVRGQADSTISPGASPGILATGSLSFTGGMFNVEIEGPDAGNTASDHDQLDVTGSVSLGNGVAAIFPVGVYVPVAGDDFVIINNDMADNTSGYFKHPLFGTPLHEGTPIDINGETLYLTYNGGDGNDVVLNTTPIINGTTGDDNFVVRRVAASANFEVSIDGGSNFVNLGAVTSITINGSGGDDTLLVDYANGQAIPGTGLVGEGLFFNGNGQATVAGDALGIRGTGTQLTTYRPDASLNGNGVVEIDGRSLTFTGLEPLDFDNVGTFTLDLANDDDDVTITNGLNSMVTGAAEGVGTVQALVLSGTSGGVSFEAAHVFRTTNVVIDTDLTTNGDDTVTIASANNVHLNTNLTINTGIGDTDSIVVNGSIANFAGAVLLRDAETVDINANVTAGTNLTIENASTVVDIAAGVTLTATSGNADLNNAVAQIDLSSTTGGTNLVAAGAAVELAPVIAGGSGPSTFNVRSGTNMTLAAITLAGSANPLLDLDIDTGTDDSATLNAIGALSAGSITVDGQGANGAFNFASTVTASSGAIAIDNAGTVDLDGNVTAATSLTISNVNTEVDLAANVNLTAQNGNVDVNNSVTLIDLSGAGTNIITALSGSVELAAVTDSANVVELEINADNNVTLDAVTLNNLAAVLLDIDVDENGGGGTLAANTLSAGQITVDGTASDDTFNFNDTVTSTDTSIAINQANQANFTQDVTAATSLTISNVNTEVDLAANVDLTAQNGNVDVNNSVTAIDLSGAGTNIITALSGSVELAAVTDSANVVELEINADNNVTLDTVTLNNLAAVLLDVDVDENGGGGTLTANALSAGQITVDGTASDDTFNFNDTVTSTDTSIAINQANQMNFTQDVTAATSLTISNVNTEVDLAANVDLTAQNGNVDVNNSVTVIDLSGAGTNVITALSGSVELAAVADSANVVELEINADNNVTLDTVTLNNLATVLLDIDVDENGGGGTLTTNALSAGQITVDGTASDDTFNFNGTVTSTDTSIAINQANQVNFAQDVTAATSLTISNVSTEVDLAADVDLTAQNGNLDVHNSVTLIDLSGAGTNLLTSTTGDVELAPVSDSGSVVKLEINAAVNVT